MAKETAKKTVKKAVKKAPAKKVVKKATTKKSAPKKVVKKAAKKVQVKKSADEILVSAVISGIEEKKGERITLVDLRKIENRVADFYVVCQAESTTQITAIADSIEFFVKKKTKELPYRTEGYQNAEWILIDYVSVVVHVFQSEMRDFYNIEGVWADADIKELSTDK